MGIAIGPIFQVISNMSWVAADLVVVWEGLGVAGGEPVTLSVAAVGVSSNRDEGYGAGAAQSPERESVGFLLTLSLVSSRLALSFASLAFNARFIAGWANFLFTDLTISLQLMSIAFELASLLGVVGVRVGVVAGAGCCWLEWLLWLY